ncbi:UNVERIFIED_CONTAM: hypothetical protein FKN15_060938 [Acipenser sinensis]
MEDTLESGWVAVRPNVFEEKEKHKFVFIVAWNEVEGKFAITCHNRTVQRQRSAGRDAAAATGVRVEDPASSTAAVIRTGEDKHKTVRITLQEKVRGRKAGAGDGIDRGEDGHREVKGESSSKIPVQGKAAVASSQIKTTQACSKVRGKSPARLLDIEILDPSVIKYGSGTAEGETAESEELESGVREHCSWAGLFSFLDLRAIHQQLCSVNSDLEPCLPLFPEEPSGVWTVLSMVQHSFIVFGNNERIKISMENDYLGPRRIESLKKEDADWQRKAHMAVLSIQDLTVKYFEITARAQKAVSDRMRVDQKKFGKAAWAAAVERMEKLQYAVSKETLQLMRAVSDRMRVDQKKFGKAAWAAAVERMEKLQYAVSKETLQLMRGKEICLEQRKHALREEMQNLQGGDEAMARLDQLESSYYDMQLQLYEIQGEILKCEELLLTTQLESIKRQMIERQDEVVYYDTYESIDAMQDTEHMAASVHLQKEDLLKLQQKGRQLEARRGRISAKKAYLRNKKDEVVYYDTYESIDAMQDTEHMAASVHLQKEDLLKLQQKGRQLEARRGRISAKKAYLRNKKEICIVNHREKMCQRQGSQEDYTSHHAMQLEICIVNHREKMCQRQGSQEDYTSHHAMQLGHVSDAPFNLVYEDPLSESEAQPGSPVRQPGELVTETLQASSTLPSAQLFDSSQLVSARKKLKKTSAMEGSQKRRTSSPMDEVLASLKRGSFHLRKMEQRAMPPSPEEDDSNNILAQIRKGVPLKKVQHEELQDSLGELPDSADPLTRSIHEALRRIKDASPESDSEDEGLPCADWDS